MEKLWRLMEECRKCGRIVSPLDDYCTHCGEDFRIKEDTCKGCSYMDIETGICMSHEGCINDEDDIRYRQM